MRYLITEQPNILGQFNTGDTVTISIYDLSDGSTETLSDNSCTEVSTTGVFKWSTSEIATQPTSLVEYLWVMGNGTFTQKGKIVLDGGGLTQEDIDNIADEVMSRDIATDTKQDSILTEVNANETKIDSIQADLDNPDQFKADVSGLATETNATDNKNETIAEVNENEAKIDAMQIVINTITDVVDWLTKWAKADERKDKTNSIYQKLEEGSDTVLLEKDYSDSDTEETLIKR